MAHYYVILIEGGPILFRTCCAIQGDVLIEENALIEAAQYCIFVGLSCAVSREGCSKNPAPSEKPHDRPTDLFFRLNSLCTHLSGSNL